LPPPSACASALSASCSAPSAGAHSPRVEAIVQAIQELDANERDQLRALLDEQS
jgi:hypothetical protein